MFFFFYTCGPFGSTYARHILERSVGFNVVNNIATSKDSVYIRKQTENPKQFIEYLCNPKQ